MQRNHPYSHVLGLILVLLFLISGCEREQVTVHEEATKPHESLFQSNVIYLDSLVFTNPVRANGQVKFDMTGTPPLIKAGDMVYYSGSECMFGKLVSFTLSGSKMIFILDKSGLDDLFRSLSIQDTISKSVIKSKKKIDTNPWNSDTLELDGLYLYNGFWQSRSLQVKVKRGKYYSNPSVGQFILSGQGSDPWYDRFGLDFNYSLDLTGELEIKAGSAMDAADSLLVGTTVYGPFMINGFPVTYQVDNWLGFHIVTERDTVITIRLSGISRGDLSLSYNYWENWKFVQNSQEQSADIEIFTGPRFSGYQCEVFESQVITPIFCGEASLSLANRFSALINSTVTIPNWQSIQTVSNRGYVLRTGQAFGDFVPGQMNTTETFLYSESQSGVLENQKPVAAFSINPPAGFTDTNFEFDASFSSDLESTIEVLMVRWDFDGDNHYDTEFSTNKLVFNKYTQPGVYQPTMEVKDAGGLTARTSASVEVSLSSSAPVASFTVNPESGRISDIFIFDAGECYDKEDAIGLLKVRWDFDGDGVWDTNWSTRKSEYYVFRVEGKYVAKLEVKDTEGLTGSTSKMIIVTPANIKPTPHFTVDPETGTTGTRFNFDASGSSDPEDLSANLRVRWDWENDGTFDTEYRTIKTIQHIFPVAGVYSVVLEVIDLQGYGATLAKEIKVSNPNTPPEADFSITPTTGRINQPIAFDASISSDNEDSLDQLEVRWDWDNDNVYDTEYSTVKTFTKSFGLPGIYIIKVQVRDKGALTNFKARVVVIE